ncbi:hypothetical protein MKX03_011301, partial [Papaver bracteatum]
GLEDSYFNRSLLIGVKRMGELDPRPFNNVYCCGVKDYSYWVSKLRDPHWHPFKPIEDYYKVCA